jgi:hypothetical protein
MDPSIRTLVRILTALFIFSSIIGLLMLLKVISGQAMLVLVLVGFSMSFSIGLMTACAAFAAKLQQQAIITLPPIERTDNNEIELRNIPKTYTVHIEVENAVNNESDNERYCNISLAKQSATIIVVEHP